MRGKTKLAKWPLEIVTIILTSLVSLLSLYNAAVIKKLDDYKQEVFAKTLEINAISSLQSGYLSYVNLLLIGIQNCRTSNDVNNDLSKKSCFDLLDSFDREIPRQQEFVNATDKARKELDLAQSKYLSAEKQNKTKSFVAQIFVYILTGIIIVINAVGLLVTKWRERILT